MNGAAYECSQPIIGKHPVKSWLVEHPSQGSFEIKLQSVLILLYCTAVNCANTKTTRKIEFLTAKSKNITSFMVLPQTAIFDLVGLKHYNF
jgi:hypothetical protein